MRVIVKKWGNSAAVRIPSAIMNTAKLRLDAVVDVREENGTIVIEQVRDEHCDLEQLIGAITPENMHEEFAVGAPVGREVL